MEKGQRIRQGQPPLREKLKGVASRELAPFLPPAFFLAGSSLYFVDFSIADLPPVPFVNQANWFISNGFKI